MFCSSCGNQYRDGVKFCSQCGKAISIRNNSVAVHQNEQKPIKETSIIKRLFNWIIDTVAWVIVMGVVGIFIDTDELSDGNAALFFFAVFIGYYSILEWELGKTIGKYITSTRVVTINGTKPDFSHILIRTICRFIPFDHFSVLLSKGTVFWHDSLSKTRVIDDK